MAIVSIKSIVVVVWALALWFEEPAVLKALLLSLGDLGVRRKRGIFLFFVLGNFEEVGLMRYFGVR